MAASPPGMWFFNNNTLNMSVTTDVTANIPVKDAGTYHLFVRSIGTSGSGFEIVLNCQTDVGTYGHGALAWQQGGDFVLKPGTIAIGKRTFFWFRFKLEPDGAATLFFKGEVDHKFDFDHTGAEQVITLDGGTMRIYGNTNVAPHPIKRDAEYLRLIANHTHY